MSHFDELELLLYSEGQLEPARASEIAAHAGQCAECAAVVRALERESSALSAALAEENESVPARIFGVSGRRVPSWVWAFAFGVFIACAYCLWTDAIAPWLDQWNSVGFGETDLVSVLLFNGAFWEGWSDVINFMELSALIITALVAIAVLWPRLRRFVVVAVVGLALAVTLALPQPAGAADVRRERSVFVSSTETVHNDLIATGQSVRIDGTVEGDVIAFTRNLTITGHVTGDVIAFANQVRIDGPVDGNLRLFSNLVTLEGSVGKNVTSFVNTLDFTSKGQIGGELISLDSSANLDGHIRRDLLGWIGRTDLTGAIGGQMRLRGGNLAVSSTAEVDGPAVFQGRVQPAVAPGAKLASPIQFEVYERPRPFRQQSRSRSVVHDVVRYGVALLAGILLAAILPGFFRAALRETGRVGLPIGVGALALVVAPFLLVFGILLLIVGVPAGFAVALVYAPLLFIAQIFVGAWLGNKILGETSGVALSAIIGRLALGLFILHAVSFVPVLGALVWIAVFLWGTGAVLLGVFRMCRAEPALAVA